MQRHHKREHMGVKGWEHLFEGLQKIPVLIKGLTYTMWKTRLVSQVSTEISKELSSIKSEIKFNIYIDILIYTQTYIHPEQWSIGPECAHVWRATVFQRCEDCLICCCQRTFWKNKGLAGARCAITPLSFIMQRLSGLVDILSAYTVQGAQTEQTQSAVITALPETHAYWSAHIHSTGGTICSTHRILLKGKVSDIPRHLNMPPIQKQHCLSIFLIGASVYVELTATSVAKAFSTSTHWTTHLHSVIWYNGRGNKRRAGMCMRGGCVTVPWELELVPHS